jgi:hypothetical protein
MAANTSIRGVEVKHVRRRDVNLEKVLEVESATGNGVLCVGHRQERGEQAEDLGEQPGPRRGCSHAEHVALSLLRLAAIHGEERYLALARATTSGTLERLR